jgi:hypothetical protein
MDNEPVSDQRREISAPAYPGDTGAADEDLAEALAAFARREAPYFDVLAVLATARLLVPAVSVPAGEAGHHHDEPDHHDHGHHHDDGGSMMAAVLLTGADGRQAFLAFTSAEAMAAWRPDARPIPVPAAAAATAARQEHAAALLVDVAGPVTFVVEGEDLRGLGSGWALARVGAKSAWIRPGGTPGNTPDNTPGNATGIGEDPH